MDSLDTDDQLTILNRSTEYHISKKLIRKIPYFDKMLSHECLESKENQVELDFDEQAVKSILDWVKRNCTMILIEMNYVIELCELADYLGLDVISKDCSIYFEDNFTIEHLPSVIPRVTKTSKCISSGALNAFICRYFTKIKNLCTDSIDNAKKTFWLEYPIETIEYICALDLMVYSEYQVFDAIMNWINFKEHSRKCHLEGLLKLVRWCHLTDEDLSKIKENELFKSSGFEPIFCSPRKVNCDCIFNRAKQNYFVMIEKLDSSELQVKVLDSNFAQLVSQVMKYDSNIPRNFFQDEHISDITYNSGMSALRIDWKHNKCTSNISPEKSFDVLQRCVIRINEDDEPIYVNPELEKYIRNGYLILEAAEAFIMISFEGGDLTYYPRPTSKDKEVKRLYDFSVIFLDNTIYLWWDRSALYEFKIQDNMLMKTWSHRLCENEFSFDDTLFTLSPAGDKIMLINKCSRKYICYDVNTKVSSKGQLVSYSSVDGQKDSNSLLTCTQTFLPMNVIRNCLNSEANSEN